MYITDHGKVDRLKLESARSGTSDWGKVLEDVGSQASSPTLTRSCTELAMSNSLDVASARGTRPTAKKLQTRNKHLADLLKNVERAESSCRVQQLQGQDQKSF